LTGGDIDLFDQTHLIDEFGSLGIAVLPRWNSAAARSGIPRRRQAIFDLRMENVVASSSNKPDDEGEDSNAGGNA
jgi:hypothetical protein